MSNEQKAAHRDINQTPKQKAKPPYRAVCVDWMTFTKSCVKDFNDTWFEISHTFKKTNVIKRNGRGYEGFGLGVNGALLARGSHILVDFTGQTMQFVRFALKMPDDKVIDWFLCRGFKATRLDGSVDSSDKGINPLIAYRYGEKENVCCPSTHRDFELDKMPVGKFAFPKNGKGMTSYFGSPRSERFLRIYDKLTEMLSKTGEIATDDNGEELEQLTRIELQCRRKVAHMFAQAVQREGLLVVPKIINEYITFLDPRDVRKKRRRQTVGWWNRIMGKDQVKLSVPQVASTPDKAIRWIKDQAVPTLRLMRDKAPQAWKKLMETWIDEYEVSPEKEMIWTAWADAKTGRKAALEKLTQDEREENALMRIQQQIEAEDRSA